MFKSRGLWGKKIITGKKIFYLTTYFPELTP